MWVISRLISESANLQFMLLPFSHQDVDFPSAGLPRGSFPGELWVWAWHSLYVARKQRMILLIFMVTRKQQRKTEGCYGSHGCHQSCGMLLRRTTSHESLRIESYAARTPKVWKSGKWDNYPKQILVMLEVKKLTDVRNPFPIASNPRRTLAVPFWKHQPGAAKKGILKDMFLEKSSFRFHMIPC
jgi:hypothetical protein